MGQGTSMKLFKEVKAHIQRAEESGNGDWFKTFDIQAFENLCREKNEKHPSLKPATLISLPDEEEVDIAWYRHSMWFSTLVEAVGEDKALLQFNAVKLLEKYCSLANAENQEVVGAAILVINYVVAKHKDVHEVENIAPYFADHEDYLWLAPVEREKFSDEGRMKFNVKVTLLIDVLFGCELMETIVSLIAVPYNPVEKVNVVDFYNFSLGK